WEAARLADIAPEVESLHADPCNMGGVPRWPRLRSLRMLNAPDELLGTKEVVTLAGHPLLERLSIRCGKLTTAAIKALAGLPLLALAKLPHLMKLDVQLLTMPAETAVAVKSACPPWVECVVPEEVG